MRLCRKGDNAKLKPWSEVMCSQYPRPRTGCLSPVFCRQRRWVCVRLPLCPSARYETFEPQSLGRSSDNYLGHPTSFLRHVHSHRVDWVNGHFCCLVVRVKHLAGWLVKITLHKLFRCGLGVAQHSGFQARNQDLRKKKAAFSTFCVMLLLHAPSSCQRGMRGDAPRRLIFGCWVTLVRVSGLPARRFRASLHQSSNSQHRNPVETSCQKAQPSLRDQLGALSWHIVRC